MATWCDLWCDRSISGAIDRSIVGAIDRSLVGAIDRSYVRLFVTWSGQLPTIIFCVAKWPGQLNTMLLSFGHLAWPAFYDAFIVWPPGLASLLRCFYRVATWPGQLTTLFFLMLIYGLVSLL